MEQLLWGAALLVAGLVSTAMLRMLRSTGSRSSARSLYVSSAPTIGGLVLIVLHGTHWRVALHPNTWFVSSLRLLCIYSSASTPVHLLRCIYSGASMCVSTCVAR